MCLGICLSFLTPGCHLLKEVIDPAADVTGVGGVGGGGVTNRVSRGRRECLKSRENKQRFPVNEVHWGPVVWESGRVWFCLKQSSCVTVHGGKEEEGQ